MLDMHDSGPPQTTVVLLHAFPCDASQWDEQAAALEHLGHRVVVPDLPGFGGSSLPQGAPDLEVVAREILAALDEIGVGEFVLGGLSLGGYVAMRLLGLASERIAGLILVDTKAQADAAAARENRLSVAERAESERSTEFLVAAMIPGLLGESTRSTNAEVVARAEAWILGTAPATVAWYQRAMAQRPDSLPDLRAFTGPALVLYGQEDTVLSPRSEQVAMVEALTDARLIEIPAAGHLSAVEQPTAVSQALVDFMDELEPQEDRSMQ